MLASEFKAAYPAFQTKQDDVVTRIIAACAPLLDATRWDDMYSLGLGALVAHTLTVEAAEQAAGPSLSVDAVSMSSTNGTLSRSAAAIERGVLHQYSRTSYGRRYMEYRRIVGMGAVSV